jgi:hypothetical protein
MYPENTEGKVTDEMPFKEFRFYPLGKVSTKER